MTTTKPAPNHAAVKALGDAVTGSNGTAEVTHAVTLPGRPVIVHLSAEEVADYLLATGWVEATILPRMRRFRIGTALAILPRYEPAEVTARALRETVRDVAKYEQRHPLDVAEAILARRGGAHAHDDECDIATVGDLISALSSRWIEARGILLGKADGSGSASFFVRTSNDGTGETAGSGSFFSRTTPNGIPNHRRSWPCSARGICTCR